LIPLVRLEVGVHVEETGETVLGVAKGAGGVVSVEESDDVEAEVALEPDNV
jgi:hypothetical protein